MEVEKLIQDLRGCANDGPCDECPYDGDGYICINRILSDAADALERLGKDT